MTYIEIIEFTLKITALCTVAIGIGLFLGNIILSLTGLGKRYEEDKSSNLNR